MACPIEKYLLSMFPSVIRVFFRNMSLETKTLLVPVDVRGMKVLDRAKFLRNIKVPIVKSTEKNVSKIVQHCRPLLLKVENFKPVQNSADEKFCKYVYLNPDKITKWEDLNENGLKNVTNIEFTRNEFSIKDVQLGYDNWSFDSIFKAVLPEGEEIVSSYSQIGHIIHLNLRDHLMEYRFLIGQVLIDKIKTCRTVVNKCNIIDNTYRNFSMEVIAGNEDYIVTVKENCCTFQFDFSKVYWNPRLGKEHERILSFLKPGDILFDVFCGVGPFAIPAVKKKCKVFANDLNPESFKWLNYNAERNKVDKLLFKSYNLDGKDFICSIFKDYLIQMCKLNEKTDKAKIHITMNLPAMAIDFLKYFKSIIVDEECLDKLNCDFLIYVYCFAVGSDPVTVAKQMVTDSMGFDMSSSILDVFNVRNVSPKKEMVRVTIKLTKEILSSNNITSIDVPPCKKLCTSNLIK